MNKQNTLGIARRTYDNSIRRVALKHEICADILHDRIVKTTKMDFADEDEADSCTLSPLSTDETQELISLWRSLCNVELEEYRMLKNIELADTFYDRPLPRPIELAGSLVHPTDEFPQHEDILEEALRLTSADRNKLYGPPEEDFSRTARLWSALLGIEVRAKDVALCMVALKLSRAKHSDHRDHYTDMAGYARCGWLCVEKE
jgi:hypothetical protein